MIRLEIKNGIQSITEVCDHCNCHIKNLTVDDILVKKSSDVVIKNSKGEVVTNTSPRPKCYCEHCNHD